MSYTKTNWQNTITPVNQTNMNKIENQLESLSTKIDSTTDYIIEQGSSGIWEYRKWNSGKAECWGNHIQSISPASSWGSTKYGSIAVAYPINLFIALPVSVASCNKQGGSGMPIVCPYSCSQTTFNAYINELSGGSYTYTINVFIYAYGKWK